MSRLQIQLPVIQNWSCHNCGGCCREHLIEITEDEKRRIDRQGWTAADGVPVSEPLIRQLGPGCYQLAHQADGACVFLDEDGLCRIHAKFGEAAKPLACRVYPYAYHPSGNDITVSLRFSCPSVVQNLGQRVLDQQDALQQVAQQIVPVKHRGTEPPAVHGEQRVDWKDFRKFLTAFDEAFTDDRVDFATQLMRVLSWLELVEQSRFETVRGAKLQDYLNLICEAACRAQPDSDLPVLQPSRTGRLMFRQLVAQLLRHDTDVTARSGLSARLGLLLSGLRFTMGVGRTPPLPDPISVARVFGRHDQSLAKHGSPDSDAADSGTAEEACQRPLFSDLEQEFGGRTPEFDRLMVRYFRVKIQGLHFCGPANFDMNLLDGFRSLALMYPATMWVARIRASCQGRRHLILEDVQASLATVDHNYAYSPALGLNSSLRRLRMLGQMQQITRLCGWYSR